MLNGKKTYNNAPRKGSNNRLTELRTENRYTQTDIVNKLSEYMGTAAISLETYRKYEQGFNKGKYPNTEVLIALSDIYGVSIDYLLNRTDLKTPENALISNVTGLNDISIDCLKLLFKTRENPNDKDTYIDTLNFLLSDYIQVRKFVRLFRECSTVKYKVPVKVNNTVADYTHGLTVEVADELRCANGNIKLRLARDEFNLYDTRTIDFDAEKLKTVALLEIQECISKASKDYMALKKHP